MSELKVHKAYNRWMDEEMPTPNDDLICNEVYLKSEADKVIADLKKACNDKDDWCLHTLKELRHHKYKRCLAMADKCVDLCYKAKDLYRWAEDENLEHYYNHKIEFFARWHRRWLKIAEKYKEMK